MSIQRLTSENAIIKTATVEVKTLTISGKQVTLAVFRQLPDESPLDLTGKQITIKGLLWGQVNYHPEKCNPEIEHIHVVWQLADRLKRGRIIAPNSIKRVDWVVHNTQGIIFNDEYEKDPIYKDYERWRHLSNDSPEDKEAFIKRMDHYAGLYAGIQGLDQLFIAV